MSDRTKSLSLKQAQNCENAKEPVCKCRCGGALHGAKRGGETPGLDFFEGLPSDDPHRLLSQDEKRERINATNREKTRIKQEKRHAAWMKLYGRAS